MSTASFTTQSATQTQRRPAARALAPRAHARDGGGRPVPRRRRPPRPELGVHAPALPRRGVGQCNSTYQNYSKTFRSRATTASTSQRTPGPRYQHHACVRRAALHAVGQQPGHAPRHLLDRERCGQYNQDMRGFLPQHHRRGELPRHVPDRLRVLHLVLPGGVRGRGPLVDRLRRPAHQHRRFLPGAADSRDCQGPHGRGRLVGPRELARRAP